MTTIDAAANLETSSVVFKLLLFISVTAVLPEKEKRKSIECPTWRTEIAQGIGMVLSVWIRSETSSSSPTPGNAQNYRNSTDSGSGQEAGHDSEKSRRMEHGNAAEWW